MVLVPSDSATSSESLSSSSSSNIDSSQTSAISSEPSGRKIKIQNHSVLITIYVFNRNKRAKFFAVKRNFIR